MLGAAAPVPVIANRTGDIQRAEVIAQPLIQGQLVFAALAVNGVGAQVLAFVVSRVNGVAQRKVTGGGVAISGDGEVGVGFSHQLAVAELITLT
ncbi:hypothetical protein D3C80_1769110 [compost metagenome]